MQARLHRRQRHTEPRGNFFTWQLLQIAQLVHLAKARRKRANRAIQVILHPPALKLLFRRWTIGRDLAPFLLQLRELQKRRKGRLLFQLPANTPRDLRQPRLKCARRTQLIHVPIRLQQGVNQHVFSVFTVAAGANHLAVHCVFVRGCQALKLLHFPWFVHHQNASRNSSGDLCRTSRLRGVVHSRASC